MDDKIKIIEIKHSVFEHNKIDADSLRHLLKEKKTYFINLMSSPGSGKTTTLIALLKLLKRKYKVAVMEADIDSDVDAKKIKESVGIETIQIHTGGMCHLDASMSKEGLDSLNLDNLDLVILENVGNLVCPAEFDTGGFKNIVILSVPEGDDKPLKYPLMFEIVDLVIVNKIDVMPYFDFSLDKLKSNVLYRNKNAKIIPISALKEEGIEEVYNYLDQEIESFKKA